MKTLLALLALVVLVSGCNLKAKAEAALKKVETDMGAQFCVAAKKFVPMGASAMAKQYDCTKAQECLQALPVVSKCFDNTLRLDKASGDVMAMAKVVCVPAVQFLAAQGAHFVADKCACNEAKLEAQMAQSSAICTAL